MKTIPALLAASLCLAPLCAQAAQMADPVQQARAALNAQQAALAQAQLDQDAANLRAYHQALAARAATIRHERAAYRAQVRQYQQAMQAWQAQVHA